MEKEYDFENMQKNFFRFAKSIEFELLNFKMSSDWELKNLYSPKTLDSKFTATYFCRKSDKCFIVKVIIPLKNSNLLLNKKLYQKLEVRARTIYEIKKKTVNPFKYFSDIEKFPLV